MQTCNSNYEATSSSTDPVNQLIVGEIVGEGYEPRSPLCSMFGSLAACQLTVLSQTSHNLQSSPLKQSLESSHSSFSLRGSVKVETNDSPLIVIQVSKIAFQLSTKLTETTVINLEYNQTPATASST